LSKVHGHSSFDNVDLGKIKARWEAGDRAEDIASEFKVHPNTIRYQAKTNGWEKGATRGLHLDKLTETQKHVVIADKVERSLEETEKFISDSDRIRQMVLSFQARLLKNRDPVMNELILDKKDADLIFQYLKCCKISMETLSIGYMGKRKAFGMDESYAQDITVLPWED